MKPKGWSFLKIKELASGRPDPGIEFFLKTPISAVSAKIIASLFIQSLSDAFECLGLKIPISIHQIVCIFPRICLKVVGCGYEEVGFGGLGD